ncbi:hypothetical protein B0O99DRAFT_683676 [Bisporella sp. PMI_857]|nr:hypothetical protein B0O99DRAFT_683676 [Bisporella sp. PMI_857]
MKSAILLGLASFLSTIHSAPTPGSMNVLLTDDGSWPVTNFVCPGGSPAGCVYSFNISFTPDPNDTSFFQEPAFNTWCNGTNIQGELQPCLDGSIKTEVVNGAQNSTLIVQHKWYQELNDGYIATVWIVGNYTWTYSEENHYTPPTTFNVPQLEQYAIA